MGKRNHVELTHFGNQSIQMIVAFCYTSIEGIVSIRRLILESSIRSVVYQGLENVLPVSSKFQHQYHHSEKS